MLQKNNNLAATRSLALVALCATLFSFSHRMGTDSFTIYLNDKVLLREFVRPEAGVKTFSLNMNNADDVLKIRYDHCGKIGSGRSISIKNNQNNVLKTWNFTGIDSPGISIKVGEIPVLPDGVDQKLYLVYSSKELPGGRLLASVITSRGEKASLDK